MGYFIDELGKNDAFDTRQAFRFENIPMVVGVSIYSFEAVGVLLNIRMSMEKPEKF
jgi:solute carrier family 36 (proton-coupled amino acid transporter)